MKQQPWRIWVNTRLILDMCSANERWHYFVITSLIGWAQTYNQPWNRSHESTVIWQLNNSKTKPNKNLSIFDGTYYKFIVLSGPFFHGSTLMTAWSDKYTHYKMWDEITYPFLNCNSCTVEVPEWISNFTLHFTGHVITYSGNKDNPCQ